MVKVQLNQEGEFIVEQDKVLLYILSGLCFAFFMYGLIDAVSHRFTNISYQSIVYILALLPARAIFRNARKKRILIRINKKGIFQEEKLITGWPNLLKAYIGQDEKKRNSIYNIQDNFILVVEYRKDGYKQGFRRRIPLTNTQNKSEEEVLVAMQYFWLEYKKGLMQVQ